MKANVNLAMNRSTIRALCVAGVFALPASTALADSHAPAHTLDLNSYATVVDQHNAAQPRLAGEFDLGLPDALPALSYGPEQISQIGFSDAIADVPLFDGISLTVGVGADLAGKFNAFDAAGSDVYDGLFFSASAVNSPYATLANGGSLFALTASPTSDLHLTLGGASLGSLHAMDWMNPTGTVARLGGAQQPYDTRSAKALLAGLSWDFARWGGIGFTASQTSERDGVLGSFDPSVQLAQTSAVGVSARMQLGDGWMTTASFAEAVTKLDLKPGFAVPSDNLRSRSYGIAIAKKGLFGNDAMGLAVTRPAGNGGDGFALLSGADAQPLFFDGDRVVESRTPETDFELGYVTTFLDGAVALQTNAAYQMNFAGQSGTNSVSLLSRAKIKF